MKYNNFYFIIILNFLDNPIENGISVGDIIAAKKKSGAKFYRAEVVSKVDNEHFNVCFIDFGTREIVNRHNIVQLSHSQVKVNCSLIYC